MNKNIKKIPKRGEIWLVDYNYKPKQGKERELEIASKIKKIRPSLVVSNDAQNEYDAEIIVVPLSSQELETIRPYELLDFLSNEIKKTAWMRTARFYLTACEILRKKLA